MNTTTLTPPQQQENPVEPPRSRRPTWVKAVAALAAVGFIAIVAGAWWLGLLTPEPDPVTLEDAVAVVAAADEPGETATAAVPDEVPGVTAEPADPVAGVMADEPVGEAAAAATAETSGASVIAGEWTIVASDATFVGYRADGQTGEAVGRSPGVTGSLSATDTQITAVDVTADMTQLTSDSSLRDSHLGDEGIEYNTYPTSTFSLTEPIVIDEIPAEGVELTFRAVGTLTVRDIAQPATVELQAALVNGTLVVVGSTEINLDDYGATISSTNEAIMEFSLVFTQP